MPTRTGLGGRKHHISCRLNTTESQILQELARQNAITPSAMIREAILREAVKPLFGRQTMESLEAASGR
jgi:hypothetical protein